MAQGLKSFKSQLENDSKIKTIVYNSGSSPNVESPETWIFIPVEQL